MTVLGAGKQSKKPPVISAAVARAAQIESDDEDRYRPIQWPLIKRLMMSLATFKWWYFIAIVLGLGQVLLDMQGPQFIKWIVNYGADYAGGKLPGISTTTASWHIVNIIGIWTLVFLGSVVLQRFVIIIMTRAGESVQFEFRRKIFGQLQRLSMSFYDRTKLGRIISRCTTDVNSLREVNVWGIWQLVSSAHDHGHRRVLHVAGRCPAFPVDRLARAGALLSIAHLSPQGGPGISDCPRRIHARQHQPRGEHHRHARRDGIQPAGPKPRCLQRPATDQHRQQHGRREGERNLSAASGSGAFLWAGDDPALRRISGGHAATSASARSWRCINIGTGSWGPSSRWELFTTS